MKTKINFLLFGVLSILLAVFPFAAQAQIQIGINIGGGPWLNNQWGLPQGSIMGIIAAFAYWILAAFGFIGIIGFVIAGIMYLTAAGNDKQAELAKNAMKYSIIGIIVGLMGFVIIRAVNAWLNQSSFF